MDRWSVAGRGDGALLSGDARGGLFAVNKSEEAKLGGPGDGRKQVGRVVQETIETRRGWMATTSVADVK